MTKDNTWLHARYAGQVAEHAAARWFRRHGWRPFATCGRESFDLLLVTSVEVKHDLAARATGQVAIEIESGGRESGIVTSTADYWLLVIDGQGVLIRTATLREHVLAGGLRQVTCAGDGATVVRLLPVDQLMELPGAQWIELKDEVES
jgi:hypothetical protein